MKTKKQIIICFFISIILISLFALSGCKISNKQANIDNKIKVELDKMVDKDFAEKDWGYGFALFDKNGIIWSSFGGYSSNEKKIKFSKDTVIRIGELSQQFVFYATLKLIEENKVNLKDTISYYLPELKNTDSERLKKVGDLSIESIIKNTSGYLSNFPASCESYDFHKDLLDYLKNANQIYPQKVKYTESLPIIDLLGLVIEKVNKEDFAFYIEKAIFNPLKMKSSTYKIEKKLKNESLFYSKIPLPESSDSKKNDFVYNTKDLKILSPSYSMRSSLSDLVKFYSILLNKKDNQKFISKDLVDLSFTPIFENQLNSEGFETGIGWHLTDFNLNYLGKVAYKIGSFLTHKVLVIILPDKDIGIVCAINKFNWGINEMIYSVAVNILKSYMDLKYNIKTKAFTEPAEKPIPEKFRSNIEGLYASQQGVLILKLDKNILNLYNNGSYSRFVYDSENKFVAKDYNQFKELQFHPEGKIVLNFNTGAKFLMQKIDFKKNYNLKNIKLNINEGVYKTDDIYFFPYSFLIKKQEGFYLIVSDDSKECLIIPLSDNEIKVLCDINSIFYDKKIFLKDDKIIINSKVYKLVK